MNHLVNEARKPDNDEGERRWRLSVNEGGVVSGACKRSRMMTIIAVY